MEFAFLFLSAAVLAEAWYSYHKISKIEDGMISLEAEIDYLEDVVQMLRKDQSRMFMENIRRSKPVKTKRKPGPGRPVNPNSARQQRLNKSK